MNGRTLRPVYVTIGLSLPRLMRIASLRFLIRTIRPIRSHSKTQSVINAKEPSSRVYIELSAAHLVVNGSHKLDTIWHNAHPQRRILRAWMNHDMLQVSHIDYKFGSMDA